MIVKTEINLCNFEGWSGGDNTLAVLSHEQIFKLQSAIEEQHPDGIDEEELNDILRYETDWIASLFDYYDWETLENHQKYGDTVKVKISDIKWDIDEEDNVNLPNEVEAEFDYNGDNDELCYAITDWLTDKYDFCHEGFNYHIIKEDE